MNPRTSVILKCREKLMAMKERYLKILRTNSLQESSPDIIDQAERELSFQNSQFFRSRMHATLEEVENALRRIENGSYGQCELSGEPIESKRLLAIPWTRVSTAALEEYAS